MLMNNLGRAGDLDRYFDDLEATRAVSSWAVEHDLLVTVPATAWRRRGGSGALLVRLHLSPAAAPQKSLDVVLKVCSAGGPAQEPANHLRAWQESPDFAARHLYRQRYPPVVMADGRVLMFLDSSESLATSMTLGQLPQAVQPHGLAATIRIVLGDWNPPAGRQRRVLSVEQFLRMELRGVLERGRSAYTWASDIGLLPGTAARFDTEDAADGLHDTVRHLRLEPVHGSTVAFLAGRSHGDLHVDNVIVPRVPGDGFDFDRVRLIDLSAFEPMAPLSRDVAALLLSLMFPAVRSGALPASPPSLVHALTSASPAATAHRTFVEDAVLSVRRSAVAQIDPGLHGMFHRQYLLSLIAQSIIYTSYSNAGDNGRRWYFSLGAAVADAYRSTSH